MRIVLGKFLTAALAVLLTTSTAAAEEPFAKRAATAADVEMFSNFDPAALPPKSGYDVELYENYVRIIKRYATVDFPGEAENRYLKIMTGKDPILEAYLAAAAKRGNAVRVYKGILTPRLFGVSGALDFWPQNRKMSKEDPAYVEFTKSGEMKSALVRRAVFSSGSLGIGVYREQMVLAGTAIRSIENKLSNRELEDAYMRVIDPK